MAHELAGKVAIITGGASGIGRATALLFAKAGAHVAVVDIDERGGHETAALITDADGEAFFIKTDVSQAREVEAMVHATVARYGRLDCAFNNAGIDGALGKTADCTEENWDRVIAINLKGVWLCMKYEIPEMLKHGKGAIVNTASVAGLVAAAQLPAYGASKGGVIQLTKTAAMEYARKGLRINALCPGGVRTPMLDKVAAVAPEILRNFIDQEPIGRIGEPEEVAAAALWLCSDAASFVTGHPMVVDGGYVLP